MLVSVIFSLPTLLLLGHPLALNHLLKVKVKVVQSYLTLCNPRDCIVHGILQTRMLEWVAFPFSMGSSQPKNWTQVSCIAGGFFSSWATWEAQIISYFSYISSICARFLLAFGVRRFHMPLIGQVVGRTLENTLQIISEWKYGQSKWFSVISLKMTTINLNLTSEMSVPWMWGSFLYTVRAGKNNT